MKIQLSECEMHDLGEKGCKITCGGETVATDGNIPHGYATSHLEFVWFNFFPDGFNRLWHTLELLLIVRQARRENVVNCRPVPDYPKSESLADLISYMRESSEWDVKHHGGDSIGFDRFMELVTPFSKVVTYEWVCEVVDEDGNVSNAISSPYLDETIGEWLTHPMAHIALCKVVSDEVKGTSDKFWAYLGEDKYDDGSDVAEHHRKEVAESTQEYDYDKANDTFTANGVPLTLKQAERVFNMQFSNETEKGLHCWSQSAYQMMSRLVLTGGVEGLSQQKK